MKSKQLLIGILISALFLFLAFRSVDFDELFRALKKTNYFYLLPATILIYLSVYFRVVRWHYLLSPVKKIDMVSLFSAMFIGLLGNYILPARMGELVFAYVIGKKESISKASAFATVVVSRIFDGIAIFLILIGVLFFLPMDDNKIIVMKYMVSIVYTIAILGVLILYFAQERLFWLLRKIFFFLPHKFIDKLLVFFENFVNGLHVLRDLKSLIIVSLLSMIIWIISALAILPVIYGFPFEAKLTLFAPFFILPVVAFGVMIPSSPGFVGTYHAFCILAINLLEPEISHNSAAGFAVLLHASQMLPIVILGFIFLWKEGLSLRNIGVDKIDEK